MSDGIGTQEKQKAAKVRKKSDHDSILRPTFAVARYSASGTLWDRNQQGSGLLQRQCNCGTYTIAGSECNTCWRKRESGFLQRFVVNNTSKIVTKPEPTEVQDFSQVNAGHNLSQVPVHNRVTRLQPSTIDQIKSRSHLPTDKNSSGNRQERSTPTFPTLRFSHSSPPNAVTPRKLPVQAKFTDNRSGNSESLELPVFHSFSESLFTRNLNQKPKWPSVLQRQMGSWQNIPREIRESDVTNDRAGLVTAQLEDLFVLYGAAWRLHRLPPSGEVYSRDWVLSSEGTNVIRRRIRAKLFRELDRPNRRERLLSYVEHMSGATNRKNEIRNMINEVFSRVSNTGGPSTRLSRFLNTGSGITGRPLGETNNLTFKQNGVELQFEISPSDPTNYRNIRPVQWLGPDVIYSKRGNPLTSSWQRRSGPGGGSGRDDPFSENVVQRGNIIAYWDSPGPNVAIYHGTNISRLHVVQNFSAWIVGDPLSGGAAEQLCRNVSWYSVVSLINHNFNNPDEVAHWERFPGNRSGIGWVSVSTPPEL